MTATLPTSVRIHPDDLAAIDAQAAEHGLQRSAFIVAKCLDRLGSIGLDSRVDSLEERIQRLERAAFERGYQPTPGYDNRYPVATRQRGNDSNEDRRQSIGRAAPLAFAT